MTKELLNEIREEVARRKEINSKLKLIKNLEKDDKVKTYMELRNIEMNKDQVKRYPTIVSEVVEDILKKYDNEDNNIFIYLKTDYYYKANWNLVFHETDIVHGKYFQNIECYKEIIVEKDELKDFEKNNIVIYPEAITRLGKDPYKVFKQIQTEYFTKAIRTNQEEAKKLIISRYKKKK